MCYAILQEGGMDDMGMCKGAAMDDMGICRSRGMKAGNDE